MIELNNVSKTYYTNAKGSGSNAIHALKDANLIVPKGTIHGVIGLSGAGKSTLFQLMTGNQQPDSGEVVIGETVDIAYVEQLRDALDNKQTVWEAVSDGQDLSLIHI